MSSRPSWDDGFATPPPPAPDRFPRDDWSCELDFEAPPWPLHPVRLGELALAAQRASQRWRQVLRGGCTWAELGADGVVLAAVDRALELKQALAEADDFNDTVPDTAGAWVVARTGPLLARACAEARAALPLAERHRLTPTLRGTVRLALDLSYRPAINGGGPWPVEPAFPRSALGRYALDDPDDPAHIKTVCWTSLDCTRTGVTTVRVTRDGVETVLSEEEWPEPPRGSKPAHSPRGTDIDPPLTPHETVPPSPPVDTPQPRALGGSGDMVLHIMS